MGAGNYLQNVSSRDCECSTKRRRRNFDDDDRCPCCNELLSGGRVVTLRLRTAAGNPVLTYTAGAALDARDNSLAASACAFHCFSFVDGTAEAWRVDELVEERLASDRNDVLESMLGFFSPTNQ